MLPQKLRNYFHYVVKIGSEEDNEYYNDYGHSLNMWYEIIIEHKAEVDLALAYFKSVALTKNKTYNFSEGSKVQSLFKEQIKVSHNHTKKGLSVESQVLKMIEFFQKKSECKILINDHIDIIKDAKVHKKAYANWILNDFKKPSFEKG